MVLLIFFNITQQFGKLLRKFSDASPNVGLFACVLQLEFILENGVFNKRTYYFLKNRINYVVSLRKDRHSSCVSYDFKVTEDYGLETEMQQQDTKYIIHGHVYARRRSKISLGRKGIECHLNHTIYKKKTGTNTGLLDSNIAFYTTKSTKKAKQLKAILSPKLFVSLGVI